jgi:hypothetical protein
MEDWEKELRDQFGDLPSPSEKILPKVEEKTNVPLVSSSNSESSPWMFFVLLIGLGILSIWLYDNKTNGSIKSLLMSTFHNKQEPTEKKEQLKEIDVQKLKAELEKFKEENKTSLDAIQAKLSGNSTKIGLMGLLLNENFSMIMKGADPSDFVFFNRDWTLDREPKYIELTEEDKEYLKKLVRPN